MADGLLITVTYQVCNTVSNGTQLRNMTRQLAEIWNAASQYGVLDGDDDVSGGYGPGGNPTDNKCVTHRQTQTDCEQDDAKDTWTRERRTDRFIYNDRLRTSIHLP